MAQIITILAGGVASPQGVILAASTQIQFNNQSGQPVTITYTANGNQGGNLFPPVSNPIPNGGNSGVLTPNYTNGAMNYTVTPSPGVAAGPYAIQLGSGNMVVGVTNNNTNPGSVVIPYGGNLQVISFDSSQYDIGWGPATPFNNLNETGTNVYTAQTLEFGYSLTAQEAGPGGEIGGGHVIIVGS